MLETDKRTPDTCPPGGVELVPSASVSRLQRWELLITEAFAPLTPPRLPIVLSLSTYFAAGALHRCA